MLAAERLALLLALRLVFVAKDADPAAAANLAGLAAVFARLRAFLFCPIDCSTDAVMSDAHVEPQRAEFLLHLLDSELLALLLGHGDDDRLHFLRELANQRFPTVTTLEAPAEGSLLVVTVSIEIREVPNECFVELLSHICLLAGNYKFPESRFKAAHAKT